MTHQTARLLMDALVTATAPSGLTDRQCLDRAAAQSEARGKELRAMSDRRAVQRSTPERRA